MRGFLLLLLSLYAALPPGVCACRLDKALWAALSAERLPDCIDDPYEHDHHCPGAQKLFVQCDQPCPQDPGIAAAQSVAEIAPVVCQVRSPAPAFTPADFDRPPLVLILCALRI